MNDVYITRAGKFLPNNPIDNDHMELFLGKIDDIASKARRIVLRNNGIKTRYYALDNQGNSTHTNATLTYKAIQTLLDADFSVQDIEVLSCGTSTPDCLLPSHAAMTHGLLQGKSIELNSCSGVCNSGINALKYGFLSVKSQNSRNAVCTGSERVSMWLYSNKYENEIQTLKQLEEQPIIAFKKDFLRWMLSDGAGAFLLENKPRGKYSLKIEWIDFYSFAHQLETCMYAGGDKLPNGEIKPWCDYDTEQWLSESVFSIKQDIKLLNENIIQKGVESLHTTLEKHQLSAEKITYFVPHVSSYFFIDKLYEGFAQQGIYIPKEKWFTNLPYVGNVGSASAYLLIEELLNSNRLRIGDTLLLSVPESGRFSYSYTLLTVV